MPKYYTYHQYEIEDYLATPEREPTPEQLKKENAYLRGVLDRQFKIVREHRERCQAAYERGFDAACNAAYLLGRSDAIEHRPAVLRNLPSRVRERRQEILQEGEEKD